MAVTDYNTNADSNSSISGINVAEGCNASGINNAIRQMMADIATMISGGGLEPSGAIKGFAGTTIPTGYLLCDGSAVSRTVYPALFTAIGQTWGGGDGSTTFNIPDYRGRVIVGAGQGTSLTNRPLASASGEESHVLGTGEVPAQTISGTTSAGSPHNHGINDPGHNHTTSLSFGDSGGTPGVPADGDPSKIDGFTAATSTATTGITTATEASHNHTFSGSTSGGGGGHNNMQPFAVANVIIKT